MKNVYNTEPFKWDLTEKKANKTFSDLKIGLGMILRYIFIIFMTNFL